MPNRSNQTQNTNPPPENSIRCGGSTKSNQSEACVGNNPIDLHLYKANAIQATFPNK